MPLTKYFLFVGGALLATLTLANFLLEPSTGARVVSAASRRLPAVDHDPQASRVERLRDEQRALQAIESDQPKQAASASSEPAMPAAIDSKAATLPSIAASTPALQDAPTSLSTETRAREIAPASVVNAKETFKGQRERKRQARHYRAKPRLPRQMFADDHRNPFANPQRSFGAYGPQASAGRFGWGNGW
jgi:hypothetical protein